MGSVIVCAMFGMLLRLLKRIKPDRRKERRAQMRVKARFGNVKGVIVDLSLGGCGFYPQDEGMEVGTRASMTLDFGVEVVHIPASAVSKDNEGLIYGIAFEQMSEENFEILNDMLVSRVVDPATPDQKDRPAEA